jgi:hypothetical protein
MVCHTKLMGRNRTVPRTAGDGAISPVNIVWHTI